MVQDSELFKQLPFVLTGTSFDFLGERYAGKVRDNYSRGDRRIIVTTDRLSCFDQVVTAVPFKGQVLNQLAVYWFNRTSDIVSNHIIDVPDPNVLVVKSCEVLPVEVVVRAYLAGSAWRDYEAGRAVSGVKLPPGLKISQKLPECLITPSTKAPQGSHDEPISEEEILSSGLVERRLWQQIREASLALFARAAAEVEKRGLLLVDTKYEFGLRDGALILVDEIHTLDSSRYWVAGTYQQKFGAGEPPEMLDKEPVRQWLLKQGYKGDGPIPHFSDEYRVQIARHYVDSYQRISGLPFEPSAGDALERIAGRLREYCK